MTNHKITSGIIASAGILRIIWTVESSAISAGLKSPVPSPSTKPMLPPIAKPVSARHALTFTFAHMSPDWISSHAALTTARGSGNTRDDKPPVRAASSHAIRIRMGTSQGAACTPARRKNGTTFIGPPGSTLPINFATHAADTTCRRFHRTVPTTDPTRALSVHAAAAEIRVRQTDTTLLDADSPTG